MKNATYWLGILSFAVGLTLPMSDAAWAQQPPAARSAGGATPAPSLNLDLSRLAVAGISSGAYMAVQAQIVFPELFRRAAILAGGPYQCAEDSVSNMVARCMYQGSPSAADVNRFVQTTLQRAKDGQIGSLSNLQNGIVYLLHGIYDDVVKPPVAEAAFAYYTQLKQQAGLTGMTITDDNNRPFGHTFPTDLPLPTAPLTNNAPNPKDDCKTSVSPYIGHCNFDGAKAILTHLYPEIDGSKVTLGGGPGKLEQVTFHSWTGTAYMEDWAYLYTPASCQNNQNCGLLVALHACNQNYTAVGDVFARLAGFNRWADAFHIAVLYPQTKTFGGNYGGCWDWWGYTNARYDTRQSQQLQRIVSMVMNLDSKR